MMDLSSLRRKTNQLLSQREFAAKQLESEKTNLETAEKQLEKKITAQQGLQAIAEAMQTKAQGQIASIVTRCLRTVFNSKSYEFKIKFKRARGKTEAELLFLKDGEEFDPKEESGGGAIDIASFALRISDIMLRQPPLRRILVSDEPFKWVNGEEKRKRLAALIEILAEEMNMQFVIVTDDDWLKIGNVVDLNMIEEAKNG